MARLWLTYSPLARAVIPVATLLTAFGCSESTSLGIPQGLSISITPARLRLSVGTRAELVASVTDMRGQVLSDREVHWSSSAPEIVAVSPTGVVTALDVGTASISASADNSVAFAHVVVPLSFLLPLRRALVVAEMGTPSADCPGDEGGVRVRGGRECSHSGVSRYSLDLADPDQWSGVSADDSETDVLVAADGVIASVCLQPAPITCGPDGPYVVIDHRGGFLSVYGHLDPASVTLRRKTRVTRGQPLGRMGQGRSDVAPWLHFELRYNNQGSSAASVLESVILGFSRFADYKAGVVYP